MTTRIRHERNVRRVLLLIGLILYSVGLYGIFLFRGKLENLLKDSARLKDILENVHNKTDFKQATKG
jgi:hypothetical protein